jgi:hypothetical protein
MIDYSKWLKEEVDVTNIDLDHYNPRLPENSTELSQNELINYLVDNYDVYEDVAKSIASKGYYPLKYIVIIQNKNSKKYTVIEGNRRVAALKSIINPDIISQKERNKFLKLTEQVDIKKIRKIPALIAPSRESVVPLLFAEHTSNPTKKWSLIMKAEFYVNELNSGKTIEDLAKECDLSISEIKDAVKLLNMYKLAHYVDLDEDVLSGVRDKDKFPASTLERVYNSKYFQEKMKFGFDSEGNFIGKCNKDEFKGVYKKVITDIIHGDIDSRSINTEDEKKAYLEKIDSYLPTKKGTCSRRDFISDKNMDEDEQIITPKKTPVSRSSRTPTGLITQGIVYKLKSASCIRKIYDALKTISVSKYPVPSAILLRVLLDKSLRYYLRSHSINTLSITEEKIVKKVKIDDVTLKQILEFICIKENPLSFDNGIIKTLKKFQQSTSNASLSALNNIIHNPDYTLNEEEVREIWVNLEALLKVVLSEE